MNFKHNPANFLKLDGLILWLIRILEKSFNRRELALKYKNDDDAYFEEIKRIESTFTGKIRIQAIKVLWDLKFASIEYLILKYFWCKIGKHSPNVMHWMKNCWVCGEDLDLMKIAQRIK